MRFSLNRKIFAALIACLLASSLSLAQTPLDTAFVYQGRLTDSAGASINDLFDFSFELFDAETAGNSLGTYCLDDVAVADGLFAVEIDFGAAAYEGDRRWMAISLRPDAGDACDANLGTYVALSPRREIAPAPNARYAVAAGSVQNDAVDDADADPTNELQDLSLSGDSLSLSDDATPVDLSGYLDNTDAQDLADVLSRGNDAGGAGIANLGAVSAASFAGDGSALTGIVDNVNDADADPANELQDLSLKANILSLSSDATSVDLSGYLDNTDAQNLANVLAQGSDAGGAGMTNLGAVSAASFAGDGSALAGIVDNVDDADADPFNELEKNGESFVIVQATSDAAANGANLLAAYAAAAAKTPHGLALAADNRATVLIPPGRYDLGSTPFSLSAEFVDLVGLSGSRDDQYLFGEAAGAGTGVVMLSANDVRIENLFIECVFAGETGADVGSFDSTLPAAFYPEVPHAVAVIRNCVFRGSLSLGGDFGIDLLGSVPMRIRVEYAGTYVDCVAEETGGIPFGGAFGGWGGAASGAFLRCVAGDNSFGGRDGVASGDFTACEARDNAFGNGGTASGEFRDCRARHDSFGGGGVASGLFVNCVGTGDLQFGSFGAATGVFINCLGGRQSFGNGGDASGGVFLNCVVDDNLGFTSNGAPSPLFVGCLLNGQLFAGNSDDSSATNELNAALALNGTTLELTDAAGTLTADLSSLQDGSGDGFVSASLNDINLVLSDAQSDQTIVSLKSISSGSSATGSGAGVFAGGSNSATNTRSVVVGGFQNMATNGESAVLGGGGNTASGNSAATLGGQGNIAGGFASVAAGVQARASTNRTFVWSDGASNPFTAQQANTFLIEATNGVGINTNDPDSALDVNGTVTATAFAGDGSALTNLPVGDNHSLDSSDGSIVDALFVDAAGNVGVGTATPAEKLDVKGSIAVSGEVVDQFLASSPDDIGLSQTDIQQSFTAGATGHLTSIAFFPNSMSGASDGTLTIHEGAGVGGAVIATAALSFDPASTMVAVALPERPLVAAGIVYTIRLLSADATAFMVRLNQNDDYAGGNVLTPIELPRDIVFETRLADGGVVFPDGTLQTTAFSAGSSSSLAASDGTPAQALVVDADGNVGVNRAAPGARLHVVGSFITGTGSNSISSGGSSAVVGGASNTLTGGLSGIFGGDGGVVSAGFAHLYGGHQNQVSGQDAGAMVGESNIVDGLRAAAVAGRLNTASSTNTFIGGGTGQTTRGANSAIVGGQGGVAEGWGSVILGGVNNVVRGDAVGSPDGRALVAADGTPVRRRSTDDLAPTSPRGAGAAIVGGSGNVAEGENAIILGGEGNVAAKRNSVAMGRGARALHEGSFVWASGLGEQGESFASTRPGEFAAQALGGAMFATSAPVEGARAGSGIRLEPGAGAWTALCDVESKENFAPVDAVSVLERVAAMPIATWNWKAQGAEVSHLGPTAQDFHAAFGLGNDDKGIATVDADGVALAAIQGLNAKLEAKQAEIDALNARLERLEKLLLERESNE